MLRTGVTGVRSFTSAAILKSHIGKVPVRLPEQVQCLVEEIPYELCKKFTNGRDSYILNKQIIVKGPKGILKTEVPPFVQIENKNNEILVTIKDKENRVQRSMWGTTRALVQNNVIGVTEGHLAIVKFVGTGYRATLEEDNGKKLVALKIGLPYTPKLRVPEGITVSSPNPTRLVIEGANKQQVKLFAAVIREHKKPEPYKGKGIFVNDETIKLKEKKIK